MTRLAPSPTGALHLGNARTFLINWALARKNNWQVVLRIEDLDGPRIKPGADQLAVTDLKWLGMDWNHGPFYQRADLAYYQSILQRLIQAGLAYPCTCTRKDIQNAVSAPHEDEHELRYPGTCSEIPQENWPVDSDLVAWRFRVNRFKSRPNAIVTFEDQIAGMQTFDVSATTGDFVIWTKAGLPAYQLAVVVDDIRQRVTEVVRGDDLLSSTARQILLYEALSELKITEQKAEPPRWWHLPLVLGPDGRRLAKRHGDSRIAWYREQGVSSEKIIGLLASWSGICKQPELMDADTFARAFDPGTLPGHPVTFTPEMHQWLLS